MIVRNLSQGILGLDRMGEMINKSVGVHRDAFTS
jgi:hypothetical protein